MTIVDDYLEKFDKLQELLLQCDELDKELKKIRNKFTLKEHQELNQKIKQKILQKTESKYLYTINP